MKKIISIFLCIIVVFVFVTGCSNKESDSVQTRNSDKVDSIDDLDKKSGTLVCTRDGVVEGGTGEFHYIVKYKNNILTYVESVDSVTIDDNEQLKVYEDAYNSINSNYEDIKYYTGIVKKKGNTVTNTIIIDYEHINTLELIELEGRDNNIYDDKNQPKLDKWLDLAKKVGVTCISSEA